MPARRKNLSYDDSYQPFVDQFVLRLSRKESATVRAEEEQKNYELAEKLLSEQNFSAAIIVGAVATVLASVAYGLTVAAWPITYGFAAAGVGIVIGFAMGYFGRGIASKFAIAASQSWGKHDLAILSTSTITRSPGVHAASGAPRLARG